VAPPGRYRAHLTVGGITHERPFEVRRDPRVKASDEDLRAHFDFMMRIRDRLSEVTDIVTAVRDMRQALAQPGSDLAGGTTSEVRTALDAIEASLMRVVGPRPHMVPPKGPEFKLAALSGVVAGSDARPTRSMEAVFEKLSAEVAAQKQRLEEVRSRVPVTN
jgi:hypothetical protein